MADRSNQISAKAQETLGLPPGFKTYSPFPFGGMNVQASPLAMADNEWLYVENFVRLGDGNMRTVWDKGLPIFTATGGRSVVWYGFFNIGVAYYCAVFLSDGSAVQVNMITFDQTQIGPPKTFYSSTGLLPYVRQWGTQYLLISNRNTPNDYWVWDGALLYGAGTVAPGGVNLLSGGFNYSLAPTITVVGGNGTGLTVSSVEQAGSVAELTITNPGSGYQVGDQAQLLFSGGGSDTSAYLQALLNPTGVGGADITTPGSGYTFANVVFSSPAGTSGFVSSVMVSPHGAGYVSANTTVVFSGGGGTGAAGTAVVGGGAISSVTITNAGTGYSSAPSVTFLSSGIGPTTVAVATATIATAAGSTATGNVTISTGVSGVDVVNAGSGYTVANVVFSGGGGTGASASANIVNGAIASITIVSPGANYTSAPTVAITGNGTGASATALIANGVISGVQVTSPGSGYTTAPTMTIIGDGSGASGIAVLNPTGVASINVVNGGSGFTSVPLLTLVGGGGAGATATAVLTGTSVAAINVTAGGSGFTSAPTLTISGGGGSGLAYTVNLNGDAVGSVTITNAGSGYTQPIQGVFSGGGGSGAGVQILYAPTSIASAVVASAGQFYTSAPEVLVTPGANNSAYATVTLMPYGVSGSAMETFLSRVWILNPAPSPTSTLPPGGNWSVSAPGSFVDFATSDGGVFALNTDAFLQTQYTQVRQSSGYLYFFGDGSVSVVSNVNTSGNPTVTTYNYQNVDPQAGCEWRDALQDFSRSTIIANATGVYGLYGGAATKISGKLDQLFNAAVFPPVAGAITPSAATATIFNIKHYLLLMTIIDPDTLAMRNVMVTWNEKDWVVTSQTIPLGFIATQKVGSSYTAYGTDGVSVYPLFASPSASLTKRWETKTYGTDKMFIEKAAQGIWFQGQDNSALAVGVSGTLSAVISGLGGGAINGYSITVPSGVSSPFLNQVEFASPYPYWNVWGTALEGNGFMSMAIRFSSKSPDFTLGNLVIGYTEVTAFFA